MLYYVNSLFRLLGRNEHATTEKTTEKTMETTIPTRTGTAIFRTLTECMEIEICI